MDGIQINAQTDVFIAYFDYLKSSKNPKERAEVEFLYETMKKIFHLSLLEGGV